MKKARLVDCLELIRFVDSQKGSERPQTLVLLRAREQQRKAASEETRVVLAKSKPAGWPGSNTAGFLGDYSHNAVPNLRVFYSEKEFERCSRIFLSKALILFLLRQLSESVLVAWLGLRPRIERAIRECDCAITTMARATNILRHLLPPSQFKTLLTGFSGRAVVATMLEKLLDRIRVDKDQLPGVCDGTLMLDNAIA